MRTTDEQASRSAERLNEFSRKGGVHQASGRFLLKVCVAASVLLVAPGFPLSSAQAQTVQAQQVEQVGQAEQSEGLTLTVSDITVENAVQLIAEHFGYKPEVHIPLPDMVSLQLQQATLDQAMNAALGKLPVDFMLESNRLHVFRPREPWARFADSGPGALGGPGAMARPAEPPKPKISRIVPLGKRRAEDVQKLMKELNPAISMVFDSPTNSLILLGDEDQVTEAETLSMNLDEMPVTARQTASAPLVLRQEYITRVFELEHVDMEEVQKEIGTVIQRQESGSSGATGQMGAAAGNLRDKDGKPIETEYFILDKARRIVLVHTTEEKFAVIKKYFDAINIPLAQVLIETHIVAIDADFERSLGMKWSTGVGYQGPGNPWSTAGNPPPVTPDQALLAGPQAFQFGKWDFRALQGFLDAAESNNKAQVLSRPRIMALNGRPASIHIGSELPYTTSSTMTDGGRVTENVDFKQVGIKLNVTPTVHSKNKTIRLHLIPEVSDKVGEARNGAPIVSTRKSETTVELADGETMVIGGLISSEESSVRGGVPMLRDIPLLGKFFQNSKRKRRKTNLIILLTTRLVNTDFAPTVKPETVQGISMLHGHPAVPTTGEGLASLTEVIRPVLIPPAPADASASLGMGKPSKAKAMEEPTHQVEFLFAAPPKKRVKKAASPASQKAIVSQAVKESKTSERANDKPNAGIQKSVNAPLPEETQFEWRAKDVTTDVRISNEGLKKRAYFEERIRQVRKAIYGPNASESISSLRGIP